MKLKQRFITLGILITPLSDHFINREVRAVKIRVSCRCKCIIITVNIQDICNVRVFELKHETLPKPPTAQAHCNPCTCNNHCHDDHRHCWICSHWFFPIPEPLPFACPLVKFTAARHVKTIDGPACLSNREMTKFHCNQASRLCSMAATALPYTLRC